MKPNLRRTTSRRLGALLGAALMLGTSTACAEDEETVTIFAAASLHGALEAFAANPPPGTSITLSTAGSGTVARQIEAGAPADIFISANESWAAYLMEEGLLEPGTTRPLASNTLVLAAHKKTKLPDLPLAELLQHKKVGRIAIGETSSVPAGIYGKEALEKLGLWQTLKPKLLPAESVRSVLSWVERREAQLGFVYESDVLGSDRLRIVHAFTSESIPALDPALYVSAIIKGKSNPTIQSVHDALHGPTMQAILKEHHFSPINQTEQGE